MSQDRTGNWRLQIGTTSSSAQPAGVNNSSPFWVNNASTAGTTYTATAQVAPSVAGEKMFVLLRETAPDGTKVASAQSPTITLTDPNAWIKVPSVNYVARKSGDAIRYSVVCSNLSGRQLLYADNMSLTSPS